MNILFTKRKSVRSFKPNPVEKEKLDEILAAANSAPSAGGLRARKIVAVEDKKMRANISEAAFGQTSIAEAPLVLAFVALPKVSAKKYDERGKNLYAVQDATLAASFAWLQAVDLELSSVWVGGFEEEKVRKVLDLGENERPIALLPIGYA
ncbi:MAG: nitroreductase family protein [Candidatus Moranbacteria bacterium]|nr:nitroreductase family protein [Candidatus Moranbacteria bacterium]